MHGELKKIKKKYGENMAKLCRELFPTILETDGLLYSLLDSKFSHSNRLYDDLIKYNLKNRFKDYIYGLLETKKSHTEINETALELLSKAGYDLYECKTEDDIQAFKKYYTKGEELCTFNGGRLKKCYVFFAVKKNVDEIKRENFTNPRREDLYGTSVISIQFTRDSSNTLSIKNRYNHRVNNPDATFSNNLENIIPGLTRSFEHDYGFNINNGKTFFEIPGYVLANDGKHYKYNYEINNIYYGPNNIIIDNFNVINKYQDKSRYLVFDYFIIDLSTKEIKLYDGKIEDSFLEGIKIKNIVILNTQDKVYKEVIINDDIKIVLDKENNMIKYYNNHLRKLNNNFLKFNRYLKEIDTPNVMKVGDYCFYSNTSVEIINLPKVLYVGKRFLYYDKSLREIHMDKLLFTDIQFCFSAENIELLDMPSLEEVANCFCRLANNVKYLYFPSLVVIRNEFMSHNGKVECFYAPKLIKMGSNVLSFAGSIKYFHAPKIKQIGEGCFTMNMEISRQLRKIK